MEKLLTNYYALIFFLATLTALLNGCSGPSVNISTNEPLKIDVNVRLDVYEHEDPKKAAGSSQKKNAPQTVVDPVTDRKNRAAEIQNFKNSRLVGEGRNGLLSVLEQPAGDYGDYVRKTVDAENADRNQIMKAQAEKEKRSLSEIQESQAEIWRTRSFGGEWIEAPQPDGSYKWIKKGDKAATQ
ncbi:MAG: DUF1318 domain-containing protein [Chthoniobacterales bacterium]